MVGDNLPVRDGTCAGVSGKERIDPMVEQEPMAEPSGVDERGESDGAKGVDEQAALARDLGEELTDVFVRFVRGELQFADLTFLTFETLQDLHIVASGHYELEYDEEEGETGEYDAAEATEQQEDLAQEPAGP